MDNTHRWPASAVMTACVLAVAAAGGWYETTVQRQAGSAAAHAMAAQRTGLESRVAAVEQDLSHANAQAESFAVQAKTARTELQAAQQKTAALTNQLADAQAEAKRERAAADQQIETLRDSHARHRFVAGRPRPQGASNITAASVRSDVAPTLPLPDLPRGATGRDYLVAAQQSLRAGSLGKAQACLERAEVRILNGAHHVHRQDVARVQHALDQLGADNRHGALRTVDHLLATQSA